MAPRAPGPDGLSTESLTRRRPEEGGAAPAPDTKEITVTVTRIAATTTAVSRHGERIFRTVTLELVHVYDGEEDFIPADEAKGRPAQSRIFVKSRCHGAVPYLVVKGSIRPLD